MVEFKFLLPRKSFVTVTRAGVKQVETALPGEWLTMGPPAVPALRQTPIMREF